METTFNKRKIEGKTAVVVGGGISGASVCYALSQRKIKTILLESESSPATQASGNPIGVVYPFLTKHKTKESEFSYLAYRYFLELWEALDLGIHVPHKDGIHFLLETSSAYDRYSNAIKSHQIPADTVLIKKEKHSNFDSLYFQKGKAISPIALTKELLRLANPELKFNSPLLRWQPSETDGKNPDDGTLICQTETESISANYLFLTQGYQFTNDPKLRWIPMKQVRGQIANIPGSICKNETSILYGDYITAELNGERVLGASFDEFHLEKEPRTKETIMMWEGLQKHLANVISEDQAIDLKNFGTRVSYRTQSQDRHPVVGKLPNVSELDTTVKYQNLFRKNGKPFQIPYFESVGILNGLGSRGLTHALLAGEILVNQITNQTMDNSKLTMEIPEHIIQSLKPDRFLLRMWKRDQLT
ncbi:FAD-dependent 5-carboxymethylaminomethyl-2-thiouridine(34) oxidoreductase MnmC [Leptospira jelokensis]|uniref:FAD-dependent 5-carboxymethylaminomethyl-2-thiouridine(34) oxidoreductase MnmC n=1 Tax=Leptospira jelokensis TaxID=2484931 RepID=UPI0010911131|nr:FAD-dependent 5-carboxymethylaminomethyl-2-thiouridine(34) oxidoreductase MnmC [Leptospira jelokensis]TGM01232.1 FAD-dependent oxidoreductase [Leptospira jelokensis]